MTVKRNRIVRSVTLDDDLVEQIKKVGESLKPKESNLSRLLDKAMAEFCQQHSPKPKKTK